MRSRLVSLLTLVVLAVPAAGQFPPEKPTLILNSGGHTAPIFQAVFSPDSGELFTVSLDKTLRIWDTETGRLLRVLRPPIGPGHEGELNAIAISPDGKTLAVAGFGFHDKERRPSPIFLIDRASGEITRALSGHFDVVGALCFSSDGKHLASGGEDHIIRIWDVSTGKLARELEGHTGMVTVLAFSPDGTKLVSAGGPHVGAVNPDRVAWIWSVEKGAVLRKLEGQHTRIVRQVAWSPDGHHIATGSKDGPSDNFVALWDADGKFIKRIAYHANRLMGCESVTFTPDPDNKSLVISLRDGFYANAGVYPLAGGEPRLLFRDNILEHDIPAGAAVVSPNGKHIAVINDRHHRTVLYNLQTGAQEHILGGAGRQPAVVAWVSSNKPGERRIAWRNRLPGQAYIKEPWEPLEDDHFFDRAFRLDELELAPAPAGKDDVYVRNQFLSGPLHLWGAGGPVVTLKNGGKDPPQLKPPGDSETNARAVTFLTPEQIVIANQTGMSLFAGIKGKGNRIHDFAGPNGAVLSVAPSPDKGRFLLASADDQVIRIWDPNQRQPLLSLFVTPPQAPQKGQPPRQGEWVAWTPQGYYAASLHGERLMGWTVNNGPDQMATFHPAQRFRQHYYRPEVIKLLLEKGSLPDALKAANVVPHQVEKTLPPRATVHFKQDGARVEVEVSAEAGSAAEPVSALHLLVDGRPAKVGDKETIETFKPAREKDAQARWTVTLEPGAHKLSVRTVAKVTYSMSQEIPIEVKGVGPMPMNKKVGTLHYIGIGVNKFKDEPELNLTGAVPDVKNMEKCLNKECTGRFEVKPTVLTDGKATGQAIVETLTGLQGKLKPNDVVIVHYSSHGEVEEGGLYLLCHDSKRGNLKGTAVPGDRLRDILGQYPCPVLLILDACHSGKFPLMRPPTDPLSRMLADDSCGVAVMTAALAHQKAIDTKDGGVFTQGLLKGLSSEAKAGAAGKRLYVHQLFTFVFEFVTEKTENKQMPLYLPSGSVPPILLKE